MQGTFHRRLVAWFVALAALAVFALQPNASEEQNTYLEHTLSCMDMLLNNPAAHAAECGGGSPAFSTDSLSDPVTENPADPCAIYQSHGGLGNAGNAAAGGNPCVASGRLAPFLMEMLAQKA